MRLNTFTDDAYDEGRQDGYDNNYVNIYNKQEEPDLWLAYKSGFEHGGMTAPELTERDSIALASRDAEAGRL